MGFDVSFKLCLNFLAAWLDLAEFELNFAKQYCIDKTCFAVVEISILRSISTISLDEPLSCLRRTSGLVDVETGCSE